MMRPNSIYNLVENPTSYLTPAEAMLVQYVGYGACNGMSLGSLLSGASFFNRLAGQAFSSSRG